MTNHWRRLAASSSLLLLALLAVAAVWSLLGGWVFLPQAGSLVWVGLGLALFLGAQLLIFRLLNLRSRADEDPLPGEPGPEPGAGTDAGEAGTNRDGDWRAWRG